MSSDSPMTAHGIDRKEWERRFQARIAERAVTTEDEKLTPDMAAEISADELDSWTTDRDDWLHITPEDAADESMSDWADDQEP